MLTHTYPNTKTFKLPKNYYPLSIKIVTQFFKSIAENPLPNNCTHRRIVRHMTHKLYNVAREANFIRAELCQSGIIEMHDYLREVGYYADDNYKALIFKKKQ